MRFVEESKRDLNRSQVVSGSSSSSSAFFTREMACDAVAVKDVIAGAKYGAKASPPTAAQMSKYEKGQ
jgi:hypothetical protein